MLGNLLNRGLSHLLGPLHTQPLQWSERLVAVQAWACNKTWLCVLHNCVCTLTLWGSVDIGDQSISDPNKYILILLNSLLFKVVWMIPTPSHTHTFHIAHKSMTSVPQDTLDISGLSFLSLSVQSLVGVGQGLSIWPYWYFGADNSLLWGLFCVL